MLTSVPDNINIIYPRLEVAVTIPILKPSQKRKRCVSGASVEF